MNNKSKKNSFLKNMLATASIASVIVGGSNAAFAVAVGGRPEARELIGNAVLSTGAGLNQSATPADVSFFSGSSLKYDADGRTINANVAGGQIISKLDLNRAKDRGAQLVFTVNTDTVINSIINSGVGNTANVVPFEVGAGQSLTLGGRTDASGLAPAADLGAEFVSNVDFAGGAGILNITTGLVANGFAITPENLNFIEFKAVNSQNVTLNINNAGANTKLVHSEVATVHTINISDDSTVEFNSVGADYTLDLQQQGENSRINFGTNGDGTLLLTSNAASHSFRVMNGSLGGNNKDGDGIIHLDNRVSSGILSHAVALP